MANEISGPIIMDAGTLLTIGGSKRLPVYAIAFSFPNAVSAETIRWNPGNAFLRGFFMNAGGGIEFCMSTNGIVAVDSFPRLAPGLLWKGAATFGFQIFPGDGFKVKSEDTVYISKNQANLAGHIQYWSPDDTGSQDPLT